MVNAVVGLGLFFLSSVMLMFLVVREDYKNFEQKIIKKLQDEHIKQKGTCPICRSFRHEDNE